MSFSRRAPVTAAHGQLTELGGGQNFLNPAAIGQLVIEMDFVIAPRDSKVVGLDAVEMTTERTHELSEIFRAARLGGKSLTSLASALCIEPGDVTGLIMQRTVFAKQFGVAPGTGLGLPNALGQIGLDQLRAIDSIGGADEISLSGLFQNETLYAE